MELIHFVWDQILLGPATNFVVVLDRVLFGSYGLAILVFTLVLKGATLPLTLKQMQSSKRMQTLQPKLQEIQKKYSDPKRRSEEQMKLYKAEGVNPVGCLVPTLIQFPIWIALYQVIRITLATTPDSLIDLSHRLYPWSFVQHAVPLASHFLWLNLAQPDKTLIMPFLVFASMWLQQKLTMTQATMSAGGQSAQTNQMMLWVMPLVFGYFSYNLPSGLGLYWVITNIAGIALNYYVFDWHKKPFGEFVREVRSGVSLSGLFMPKPRPGARPGRSAAPARGARPNTRPALTERRNGRAESSVDADVADVDSSAAGNGTRRPGAPIRPARRRTTGAPPPKGQPKAPPVVRRTSPPATGRLGSDSAGSNGGPEARSSDG